MTSGSTLVVCLLAPVTWAPGGTDLPRWRAALAEDVVDLLAPLPLVRAAIAATPEDMALARSIAWPSMPILEIDRATLRAALDAASTFAAAESRHREAPDGHPASGTPANPGDGDTSDADDGPVERVAVVLADAPDLPAMLIGKLLRPLTSRAVAIAPAVDGGLLGVATTLPVPDWLPDLDPDTGTVSQARARAPEPSAVVSTPSWHRLRGAVDLARLDPGLDGWETTRMLLSS